MNYYEVLEVSPQADRQTIKQAYRRLAKRFHPDAQKGRENNRDRIVLINAAYEVLGDPQSRLRYDRQRQQLYTSATTKRQARAAQAQSQYRQAQQRQQAVIDLYAWLQEVYQPVSRWVQAIITPLDEQIDSLAADPFDDTLMNEFQDYIAASRESLQTAYNLFQSQPNPAKVAGTAAHLYYCLNQLGDALNELEWFTLNYDEHYLHAGQEMFRIAHRLYEQAQEFASTS